MPTYVVRHGYRLSYEFGKEIMSSKLKNIKYVDRYKQTDGIDEPLGPRGHNESIKTGKNLSKLLDFSKPIKVYCSPMTRCVQTAVHIVDELRKINPDIMICIEYNLAEKLSMDRKYIFKNGEVDVKLNKYAMIENTRYNTPIDDFLSLNNIIKRNKNYIDKNYKSKVSQQSYLVDDYMSDCFALVSKCYTQMKLNNEYNNIIISHALQCAGIYGYLQKKINESDLEKFWGRNGTNITFGWDKKIIYGPTRDFLD